MGYYGITSIFTEGGDCSVHRRRAAALASPSFLSPAFSACTADKLTSSTAGLHRYIRSPSSSSGSTVERSPAVSAYSLLRHLRLPLSSTNSVSLFAAAPAVKVEEDVLVMDAVLVPDSADSAPSRARWGDPAPASGSCRSSNSWHKAEICRSWQERGLCRYGSKCQFAHGNEEQHRSDCRPTKLKSEATLSQSSGKWSVPSVGPGIYSSSENPSCRSTSTEPELAFEPQSTFSWPPTEEQDAYFTQVLSTPSNKPRLPVFIDICPE